ncbi:putative ABC transport system permease protein [Reichenbachiella faecimaris]|uniref:Putative ABC transport system permease protein n=1 Tax=Reichenbachiella faecimaris TaxID=692418 RepID=A0A1W2GQE0_REIFA|nr:ABC transporter permease [Reichenbachiella faecimaris]SMD38895.1 putative ABC transport system permease protein [Reichenbachiella faecimaris]
MLKNFINIAFRNLLKHKFYSFLNILGLSIGLSCFMVISLFVTDELSFDAFHKDSENIYRVDFAAKLNGSDHIAGKVGAPAAQALLNDYPIVKDAIRVSATGNWFIKEKGFEKTFKEEHVLMADSNFFSFFTVPMIHGNPETVLVRPNTLVMDQTTARKMFGQDNPVGKTLVLDNTTDYEVTGVYEDLPKNSHFRQNIILSVASFPRRAKSTNWVNTSFNTYIKFQDGIDSKQLEENFPELIEKYIGPLIQKFFGQSLAEFKEAGNNVGFSLFPMEMIHLHSDKDGELAPNSDISYIYIFSAVAIFILLLACINFMNLATARSASRAKEVGVRKVMGALKNQLIYQFISEALVISFFSFLIAYLLTIVFLPSFNELASKELTVAQLFNGTYVLLMVVIMLVVGLFAGSYPAFYLSRFQPAEVLKGKVKLGMKSGALRSLLVIFQFSISIVLMIGTAVVFDQLSFIQNKKLGFNKDQILMVEDAWILDKKVETFKTEVKRNINVENATVASFTPVGGNNNSDLFFKSPSGEADQSMVIDLAEVDHDFIETLGIEMAKGRFFSKEFLSDSNSVVINKAAVKMFGYENPIGDKIYTYGGSQEEPEVLDFKIIGVMEDFHFKSLRDNITPLVFFLGKSTGFAMFKINTGNIQQTIADIEQTWADIAPGQPFTYSFMDQKFDSMYEAEQKIGKIFTVFAILGILIACLGLFGLASFTAEQKTKEIGIRKALGASSSGIVFMLSKNFIKLVAVAFVLAVPAAYFAMGYWLEDFAYRTEIKPVTFIGIGILAFAIAWLTMGFQSWKAARLNPVQSLREE